MIKAGPMFQAASAGKCFGKSPEDIFFDEAPLYETRLRHGTASRIPFPPDPLAALSLSRTVCQGMLETVPPPPGTSWLKIGVWSLAPVLYPTTQLPQPRLTRRREQNCFSQACREHNVTDVKSL